MIAILQFIFYHFCAIIAIAHRAYSFDKWGVIMTLAELQSLISAKQPIHLSGIGGVSMRALAELLLHMGARVQGSDRERSPFTDHLEALGVRIYIGQREENVLGAAAVIRTAAVLDQNPEIVAARRLGLPVVERGQAWGLIMGLYDHAICIAGTHGKTSTTSMVATFALDAGLDPTVMVGGELSSIGGGTLRIGGRDLFIAEACEYKNSYHSFCPTAAVILNIDRDHLDFFRDTEDIIASFRHFASLVPPHGAIIANRDDANTMQAVNGLPRRLITFGLRPDADVRACEISCRDGMYSFDISCFGKPWGRADLSVPGEHNLYNALAAAACAVFLGTSPEAFAHGLAQYRGVGRRFEPHGRYNGALLFDDYAHHPSEIEATLTAARAMNPKRVICVFQPHTYSRTISLRNEFAQALSHADLCVITDIYASREINTAGINSHYLSDLIPDSVCVGSFDEARRLIARSARPGDIIFSMGAGDVFKIWDGFPPEPAPCEDCPNRPL